MNRFTKLTASIALAMALTLTACGGGLSPEEVAEKFAKALFNSDYGTAKKFASEKMKKDIEEDEAKAKAKEVPPEKKELYDKMKALTPKAAEPANISEDGNSATVKLPLAGLFDMKVKLVKENDAWKVDGMDK